MRRAASFDAIMVGAIAAGIAARGSPALDAARQRRLRRAAPTRGLHERDHNCRASAARLRQLRDGVPHRAAMTPSHASRERPRRMERPPPDRSLSVAAAGHPRLEAAERVCWVRNGRRLRAAAAAPTSPAGAAGSACPGRCRSESARPIRRSACAQQRPVGGIVVAQERLVQPARLGVLRHEHHSRLLAAPSAAGCGRCGTSRSRSPSVTAGSSAPGRRGSCCA